MFPHLKRLCEYLFDKQAVKHFPPDLIGEEFTFLFAARRTPLSLIYTVASNSSCEMDAKSSTNTFLCCLSHIHSPQVLPTRKLTVENPSKQTPRWECMRGLAWADLNTISPKPPGLDRAWIKAAVAAASLQRKCSVWREAKVREKSHAWPSCSVSLQIWPGSPEKKESCNTANLLNQHLL